MKKDTKLVNIYLKIHNKRPLTMDDLGYLAQYAPECFEKTCKNVVYNIPKAKPVMEPDILTQEENGLLPKEADGQAAEEAVESYRAVKRIEQILDNIKRLEEKTFPVAEIEAEQVKELLGNLYMELLFPHNGRDTFFDTQSRERSSSFDAKA